MLAASGTGVAVNSSPNKDSIYDNYGVLEFVSDKKDVLIYPWVGDYSTTYDLAKAENKDADPTHSEYYFNGKRVKFLPKTTFVYVWKETTHPKTQFMQKQRKLLILSIPNKPRMKRHLFKSYQLSIMIFHLHRQYCQKINKI